MFLKIQKALIHPKASLLFLLRKNAFHWIPDSLFLKIEFRLTMGNRLNLTPAQTFSEKLQWLKLHDRNPLYTKMADKWSVRQVLLEKAGKDRLIPIIQTFTVDEEIDFESLPDQFVLKPNHTSGNTFICKDKNAIDRDALRKEVRRWMKRRYFWEHREWPYKGIQPKLLCEKNLGELGSPFREIGFFCFNGLPLFACEEHPAKNPHSNAYTVCDLRSRFPGKKDTIQKLEMPQDPAKKEDYRPCQIWKSADVQTMFPNFSLLERMIGLCVRLSEHTRFVRLDFYLFEDRFFFGECAFFPLAGIQPFQQPEWDLLFGKCLDLPVSNDRVPSKTSPRRTSKRGANQ